MVTALLKRVKYVVGTYGRATYRQLRASLRSREQVEAEFRSRYFADVAVDVDAIGEFRAECFPKSGPTPWLDRPDALDQIQQRESKGELTPADASACRKWASDGYYIAPGLFEHRFLDEVWSAYEQAVVNKTITLDPEKASENDPWPGRHLNPHIRVPALDQMLRHDALRHWNELFLGKKIHDFQTITAHKGSQQKEHSDSIHMTTYPLGYLTAAWIAFEDISADSGPLVYYPGSHKLPYMLSQQVGLAPRQYRRQPKLYGDIYENAIQKAISDNNCTPAYFLAKKGDVLFWHANLIHGGSERKNIALSRRSLVCHYFAKGAVCYHDLAGLPADSKRAPTTDPMIKDMLM